MNKKLLAFNAIPMLISVLFYMQVANSSLPFWVIYDAAIAPTFLLLINILAWKKSLKVKYLILPFAISCLCVIIHMAYFQFDFEPISRLIWFFILLSNVLTFIIGGSITFFIFKTIRKTKSSN